MVLVGFDGDQVVIWRLPWVDGEVLTSEEKCQKRALNNQDCPHQLTNIGFGNGPLASGLIGSQMPGKFESATWAF